MGIIHTVRSQTKDVPTEADVEEIALDETHRAQSKDSNLQTDVSIVLEAGGVADAEGIQAIWGKHGRCILWAGYVF